MHMYIDTVMVPVIMSKAKMAIFQVIKLCNIVQYALYTVNANHN